MRALKFLERGAVGPFTGFAWPTPSRGQPGDWVSAPQEDLEDRGIHACRPLDLSYWLDEELWVIELGAPIVERSTQVVAGRGRLIERVGAWNEATRRAFAEACVLRAKDTVARALAARGAEREAASLAAAATIDSISAAASPLVSAFPLVSYVTDALYCLGDCGAASSVGANAAAAASAMPRAAEDERRGQSRWLMDRLGLS